MENKFLKNTESIRSRSPKLADTIVARADEAAKRFEILNTDSNNKTIKDPQTGITFYEGMRDPFFAALQTIIKLELGIGGVTYVLGFGTGYIIRAISQMMAQTHRIIVLEKNPDVIATACHLTDYSATFSDARIEIRVGDKCDFREGELESETLLYRDFNIVETPSVQLDPDFYNSLKLRIGTYTDQVRMAVTATLGFAPAKTRNLIHNLHYIRESSPLDVLFDKFKGTPAICVSSGPSLKKNIDTIQKAKGKALIIAVDSVAQVLEKHGIVPDIITTLDASPMIVDKFADFHLDTNDIHFVYLPAGNPGVVCKFPKRFISVTGGKSYQWCTKEIYPFKVLPLECLTVAHLSMNVAYLLGCEPIIMVGQDLSFPDDESHVEGVRFSHREEWVKRSADIYVKGIDGKPVRTVFSFVRMKTMFEDFIKETQAVVINSTEGGAHIEGTTVMPLAESIGEYCKNGNGADVKQKLDEGFAAGIEVMRSKITTSFVDDITTGLHDLRKLSTKALTLLESVKKTCLEEGREQLPPMVGKIKDLPLEILNHEDFGAGLLYDIFMPAQLFLREALSLSKSYSPKDWFNIQSTLVSELDTVIKHVIEQFGFLKKRMNAPFDGAKFVDLSEEEKKFCIASLIKNEYYEEALEYSKDDEKWSAKVRDDKKTVEYLRVIEENINYLTNLCADRLKKIKFDAVKRYMNEAAELIEDGDLESAKVCIHTLMALKPDNLDGILAAAKIEYSLGNYPESNKWCILGIQKRPQCADLFFQLTHNFMALNDKEKAIQMLKGAESVYPDSDKIAPLVKQVEAM